MMIAYACVNEIGKGTRINYLFLHFFQGKSLKYFLFKLTFASTSLSILKMNLFY